MVGDVGLCGPAVRGSFQYRCMAAQPNLLVAHGIGILNGITSPIIGGGFFIANVGLPKSLVGWVDGFIVDPTRHRLTN